MGVNISVYADTWELVKERTWIETEDFPTSQIVFYETVNGLKKAIGQINGSGVCAIFSAIYDIELKGDTICLKDGMNLKDGMDLEPARERKFPFPQVLSLYLKNETTLILENVEYEKIDMPLICNWTGISSGVIPIEKLKEIPLQEKMIYDRNRLLVSFGLINIENCGNDDNPTLTEIEATFLNECIEFSAQSKGFDFNNKRILFVGNGKGSKSTYFDDVKEWRLRYNGKIAASLIVLDESDKAEYGYDAILTYWLKKELSLKERKKILERRAAVEKYKN